ncbi:hypothetical protein KY334_06035 [Candidatus Woesearchaeota archaeon]|nr:hypothetical protein [Candidatus Woesearchaeota archaeon]
MISNSKVLKFMKREENIQILEYLIAKMSKEYLIGNINTEKDDLYFGEESKIEKILEKSWEDIQEHMDIGKAKIPKIEPKPGTNKELFLQNLFYKSPVPVISSSMIGLFGLIKFSKMGLEDYFLYSEIAGVAYLGFFKILSSGIEIIRENKNSTSGYVLCNRPDTLYVKKYFNDSLKETITHELTHSIQLQNQGPIKRNFYTFGNYSYIKEGFATFLERRVNQKNSDGRYNDNLIKEIITHIYTHKFLSRFCKREKINFPNEIFEKLDIPIGKKPDPYLFGLSAVACMVEKYGRDVLDILALGKPFPKEYLI